MRKESKIKIGHFITAAKAVLLAAALSLQTIQASADGSQSNCRGCADLKKVEAQFLAIKRGKEDSAFDLLAKASDIVARMPGRDLKLTPDQITQITEVLKAAFPFDPAYAIIDNNFEIFQKNERAFFREFKKLSKEDAQNLASALDIKLAEGAFGQDSDSDSEANLPPRPPQKPSSKQNRK
jgi:hypothetical protein